MEKTEFDACVARNRERIERIRETAHRLHESVNQKYGKDRPYGFHLDMTAESLFEYGHHVLAREEDLVPLAFGLWFHDSMEDARLTYHNVQDYATRLGMDAGQMELAAEIVYALTNEKGRTRKERANAKYYEGIRVTPYAPFAKLCDRLANIRFSFRMDDTTNRIMAGVYRSEFPEFIQAIKVHTDDIRFSLPEEMVDECYKILNDK